MPRATGPWATTARPPSHPSGRRWATARCCWPCPAAWIPPLLAALLAEAVGNQLTCVFVDHGLMRKNEGDEVEAAFAKWDINFVRVDAEQRFLGKLAGVTEPEQKRKIIGEEFIRVFEEEGKKIGYGGLSGSGHHLSRRHRVRHGRCRRHQEPPQRGRSARITWTSRRSSSLCACCLRMRCVQLGRELGLPEYLVQRQPFPGPGLAIRIIGEITKEKARYPAGCRRHLPGGDRQGRSGHTDQPVFCRADQYALRGRYGRRPHL